MGEGVLIALNGVLAVATIVLVVVTWLYVRPTKRMADASVESARYAKEAAEAAASSARATVASVEVAFDVRPLGLDNPRDFLGPSVLGIDVICRGATVFLHRGWVLATSLQHAPPDEDGEPGYIQWTEKDVPVVPRGPEPAQLPVQMHQGEELFCQVPNLVLPQYGIAVLRVALDYSLDGSEPTRRRRVSFRGKFGGKLDVDRYVLEDPTV